MIGIYCIIRVKELEYYNKVVFNYIFHLGQEKNLTKKYIKHLIFSEI